MDPGVPGMNSDEDQGASLIVEAVYTDGVIKPLKPLELPADTRLQLRITTRVVASTVVAPSGLGATPASSIPALSSSPALVGAIQDAARSSARWLKLWSKTLRFEAALFALGVGIYMLTRLWDLVRFPIFFFCDEAIQANLAEMLLRNGLRDNQGHLLPPYFLNAEKWNLGWTVYVQMISLGLFGKSEYVTRATSGVISLMAAIAIALILKVIFNSRSWWIGVLVLATVPAWFLHSRTAFETVMMVSFYACFLLCYLLYCYRDPFYLYPALLFGGMTFYSYANGQGVMLVSGVLLLLSDARYHLQNRRELFLGALLTALLAIPLLRFRSLQPDALQGQFQALHSYWLEPLALSQKLQIYGRTYIKGISPAYWFLPNDVDLSRHRMAGMGNIWLPFLPLFLIGLVIALRNWQSSAHRALLIAILAAPASAAVVDIAITRVLSFVVPATILICLGIEQIQQWTKKWVPYRFFSLASTTLLILVSLGMLRAALVSGPTWFTDYGLGGMQYGAPQLFRVIPQILREAPETRVFLSSTWANNPNAFADFYLDSTQRARFAFSTAEGYMMRKQPLDESMLFIMTADEFEQAKASRKFVIQPPERILRYPDGRAGFYFVRMVYVANIDEILEDDLAARMELVSGQAVIDGQAVEVRHSVLDVGRVAHLFDNDMRTLMRGLEANPLVLELEFSDPQRVERVGLDLGTMARFEIRIEATVPGEAEPRRLTKQFEDLPNDPHVDLAIPGGAQTLQKLRIEVFDYGQEGAQAHIHWRNLALR